MVDIKEVCDKGREILFEILCDKFLIINDFDQVALPGDIDKVRYA